MAVTSMSKSSIGDFERRNKIKGTPIASATGGNFTIDEDGYRFLVFTTSGTLTVTEAGNFDLCIIGGGGGGGSAPDNSNAGGGGGAGGMYLLESVPLPVGDQDVAVGAGGGEANWSSFGKSGADSYVGTESLAWVADGGGGGGRVNSGGIAGGSGGGAATNGITSVAPGFFGQGFAGGSPSTSTACGGGGAGEIGGPANGGAPGGDGRIATFVNTTVANTASVGEIVGSDVYFSGGGGGGGASSIGGLGGGGNGTNNNVRGNAGTDGTGGGGGSGRAGSGGAGGDGCVIVRFKL